MDRKKRFEEVVDGFLEHKAIGPTGKMALLEAHLNAVRQAEAQGALQALDELQAIITKETTLLTCRLREDSTILRRGFDRLKLGARAVGMVNRVRAGGSNEEFIVDVHARKYRVSGLGDGEILIERYETQEGLSS